MKSYNIPLNTGDVNSIRVVKYPGLWYCCVFVHRRSGGYKTYRTACKCVARLAGCEIGAASSALALKIVRDGLTRGEKAALTMMMK